MLKDSPSRSMTEGSNLFNDYEKIWPRRIFDILFPYNIGEFPRPLCEPKPWAKAIALRDEYRAAIKKSDTHPDLSTEWWRERCTAFLVRCKLKDLGYHLMLPRGWELEPNKEVRDNMHFMTQGM